VIYYFLAQEEYNRQQLVQSTLEEASS
jgi:hypothetical protein